MVKPIVAAAFAFIACLAAPDARAQTSPPACAAPAHRAFDFWIGEWDAYVSGTENLAGRSTIASTDAGCVITEHWRSRRAAYSGRSLNTFDRPSGKWVQVWMDSAGDLTRFVGGAPNEGQMVLVAENDVSPSDPTPKWRRMTFTRNEDGSVRQHGESSPDRGATWRSDYDFTYRPAKSE
mgnify:CR=1 FL=1